MGVSIGPLLFRNGNYLISPMTSLALSKNFSASSTVIAASNSDISRVME
jgi:hypothetical protein